MNKRSRQRKNQMKDLNAVMSKGYTRKQAKALMAEYKNYSKSGVFQNAAKKFNYETYTKAMGEANGAIYFKEKGAYEAIKRYEEARKLGLISEDSLKFNHDDFDSNSFAYAIVNNLFDDMKNYITTAVEKAEENWDWVQGKLDSINIKELPTYEGW